MTQNNLALESDLEEFINEYCLSTQHDGIYLVLSDIKAYKKILHHDLKGRLIVEMTIPKGALIHIPVPRFPVSKYLDTFPEPTRQLGGKFRASCAIIDSIVSPLSDVEYESGLSGYDETTVYRKGETVVPDEFSLVDEECMGGIHFFLIHYKACTYMLFPKQAQIFKP